MNVMNETMKGSQLSSSALGIHPQILEHKILT